MTCAHGFDRNIQSAILLDTCCAILLAEGPMRRRSIRRIGQFASIALFAFTAFAQQLAPAIPPTGFPGLDQYRASRIAVFTDDYGELGHYREVNAAAPVAGENRV